MHGDRIAPFLESDPRVRFEIEDQLRHDDKVWSQLVARSSGGSVAHGMDVSRFVDNKIAQQWAIWGPRELVDSLAIGRAADQTTRGPIRDPAGYGGAYPQICPAALDAVGRGSR